MPTDPSTPRRPGRDDAYTVDTRRRPKRGGGAIAPSHAEERDPDVVDTRGPRESGGSPTGPIAHGEPRRRRRKGRVVLVTLLVLLLAWVGFMVWVPMQAWGSVNKVDNIPDGERPTD